jgi:hypothetical protein
MADTKATTDATAEPTAQAAEPVADPLPWLLRNTVQRRARSATGVKDRGARDEADRRSDPDSRNV